MKLPIKLFDAVVSPCALFETSVLPIYQKMMDKFDITRRKMLRKMVGWVRYPEEDWSTTMKRMNDRAECALHQWPCKTWSDRIILNRWQYAGRVRHLPQNSWVDSSLSVLPVRPRGRPLLKWDADLSTFSMAMFRCAWFNVNLSRDWVGKKDAYLRWCGIFPSL